MRINSFLFSIVFLLLIHKNAICQKKELADNQPKYNIGIELGPNLSSIINGYRNEISYVFKMGYSGGVFFQYQINPFLSLRTNIAYTKKIYAEEFALQSITGDYSYFESNEIRHFINVPLLIKFNLKNNRLFVNAGPDFDLLVNWRNRVLINDKVVNDEIHKSTFLNMNLAIGIGTNVPVGKKYSLTFEVRDNFNFLDYFGKHSNRPKWCKNSVFFLYGIVYHFSIKNKK
jgi:hypothetical protein